LTVTTDIPLTPKHIAMRWRFQNRIFYKWLVLPSVESSAGSSMIPTMANPVKMDQWNDEKQAKTEAEELKGKGNVSYKARRFEEAIDLYQKAWELYPKDVSFFTNMSG